MTTGESRWRRQSAGAWRRASSAAVPGERPRRLPLPGQRQLAAVKAGSGRRPGAPAPRFGTLRTVTTRLRAGYLRKNGVPYSENAVLTEYWDLVPLPGGDQLLVVTSQVDDPAFLSQPFLTSAHFKKETDGAGWDPTPCSSPW